MQVDVWLAACLVLAVAGRSVAHRANARLSTLNEFTAALLAANRPEGSTSIILTDDIYIDGDLLRALPELSRDVRIQGRSREVAVMVDELLEVARVQRNVTMTFSFLTFRYRRLVSLGTMLAGLLDLTDGGRMVMDNVTLEVTERSMGLLKDALAGDFPAGQVEGIVYRPGNTVAVSSLALGSIEVRDALFRTYHESDDLWPQPLEFQASEAWQLVEHMRSGETPLPLHPVRITLQQTIAVSLKDMGPDGAVQVRRKVVLRGPGEPDVFLLLNNDLVDGGFANVTSSGVLVFEDLNYEYEAAVAPSATIGACGDPSCISTDVELPYSYDKSTAVCRFVISNTTMHTRCSFTKGLAKWLFLRQTAPAGARGASVVNHPGLAEMASLNAGGNESFNIRFFIGSGTCAHESEITCKPIPIPRPQDAPQSEVPPEDEDIPEVESLASPTEDDAPSGSDGVDVGEGTAVATVCIALVFVVAIASAIALRHRAWSRRHDDTEDGQWMGQPLARCSDSVLSEGTSSSCRRNPPSPTPSPPAPQQEREGGRGAAEAACGDGSGSLDKSVSGGTLMDMKWRELRGELREEMHKMNEDSVQLLEQIGSGGYGVVYKGVWRGLPVAIKTVMFQDLEGKDSKQRRRAVYEAAISSSVVYPNVVQTYSYFFRRLTPKRDRASSTVANHCVDWKLYIVQEFCQLGSLLRSLKRGQFVDLSTKAPDMEAIVEVALGVARGMQHIHDHDIIHGDLTARNVLLQSDRSGSGYVAKVSDFGLSVKLDRYQNHISECYAGTPLYMAPELGMHGRLSKAADVYSFGIMLWELFHLSLQAPVSFSKVAACRKGPPRFSRLCPMPYALLCAVCLSPHPSDRPNFEQVAEILQRQLAMIRMLRFPKREDVESFNSEWVRGIVGLKPREALTYMMCNLPSSQPVDEEGLSTVEEESAGAGLAASAAGGTSSSDQGCLTLCSTIPNTDEEDPFYTQDPVYSENSGEKLVEKKPSTHVRRQSKFSGLDSGEIQIEMGPGWDLKLGTDEQVPGGNGQLAHINSDKLSCSFSSSCTIEQTYSCDEQFMSIGWDSRMQGQGHVDKGLNPMGLLNYKQVPNCTRSCEYVARSQPGSKSCEATMKSQQESKSCEGVAMSKQDSRSCEGTVKPRHGSREGSHDSRRRSTNFTGRTTEESDYFSM